MKDDEILNLVIPYRLECVRSLKWAYDGFDEFGPPKEMQVVVDGKVLLKGNTNALFNPMFELGFIHARSLLQFMGLSASDRKLVAVTSRRPDDIAIENVATKGIKLQKVSPEMALDQYTGPREDGERALVSMIELANKGVAHLTSEFPQGYTSRDLDRACTGIPQLIYTFVYEKLGMAMPPAPAQWTGLNI